MLRLAAAATAAAFALASSSSSSSASSFSSASASLSASAPRAAADESFTLHLLDAAAFPMAQCLDGSMGGFYMQPGSGSGATKWVVHTQ